MLLAPGWHINSCRKIDILKSGLPTFSAVWNLQGKIGMGWPLV